VGHVLSFPYIFVLLLFYTYWPLSDWFKTPDWCGQEIEKGLSTLWILQYVIPIIQEHAWYPLGLLHYDVEKQKLLHLDFANPQAVHLPDSKSF
jgi:hypothetical protein